MGGGRSRAAERQAAEAQRQAAAEAKAEAERARREEAERQRRLEQSVAEVDTAFGRFDDTYYGNVGQSYLDFALPDLAQQQQDARKKLAFALARAGQSNSSVAADAWADLDVDFADATRQIHGRADDMVSDFRGSVSNAYNRTMSLAQANADPAAARAAAIQSVNALQPPQSFSPLGPLFANVGAGIGTVIRADQDRRSRQRIDDLLYQTQDQSRTVN